MLSCFAIHVNTIYSVYFFYLLEFLKYVKQHFIFGESLIYETNLKLTLPYLYSKSTGVVPYSGIFSSFILYFYFRSK